MEQAEAKIDGERAAAAIAAEILLPAERDVGRTAERSQPDPFGYGYAKTPTVAVSGIRGRNSSTRNNALRHIPL